MKLYQVVREKLIHSDILGGHAATFARRAQLERCQCLITPQYTEFNLKNLKVTSALAKAHLLVPDAEMELETKHKDVHLVLEYNERDSVLGFTAPRSNRFYFDHDPNGSAFKQMETYHGELKNYPQVKRHMFGGF